MLPSDGEYTIHPYFSLRFWIDKSRQDPDHDACGLNVFLHSCEQIQDGNNLKEIINKDCLGSQLQMVHSTRCSWVGECVMMKVYLIYGSQEA